MTDHAGTCVVERCSHRRLPGWPWCEDHRPRFDREPVRTPMPQSPTDRVRAAVRRWEDWEDEAIAAYAGVSRDYVVVVRRMMGRHRQIIERTLVQR